MTEYPGKNIEPDNPEDIFKEKFPSLQGKAYCTEHRDGPYQEKYNPEMECDWLHKKDIQEHTIDKKVVRKAYHKLKNYIDTHEGFRPYSEGFAQFVTELNLDKDSEKELSK